jgi:TolA-binding protein
MKRLFILLFAASSFMLVSCGSENTKSTENSEMTEGEGTELNSNEAEEIQEASSETIASDTEELQQMKEDIESSSEKLDSLLNEL